MKIDAMKNERIVTQATIHCFNRDGKEVVKQLIISDKNVFFYCVELFADVIHIANIRLVEMHYTAPAGRNTRNVTEWYTVIGGKAVMTNRYED